MIGKLRVSCASLCRIQDKQGRYLLALNQNRLLAGRRVLMALGGALQYDDPDLPTRFEAVLENAALPELRLYMPPKALTPFREWFLARQERETDPYRELREELVDELGALDELAPHDVQIMYVNTLAGNRITDRPGAEGEVTYYWLEIFRVEFSEATCARLLAEPPGLRWVTEDEIHAGVTADGVAVAAEILLGD
jgi:hypothetical protein